MVRLKETSHQVDLQEVDISIPYGAIKSYLNK